MVSVELLKKIILERPAIKKYVRRDIDTRFLQLNKIFTIVGPRRSGKTYFLFQLMDELLRKGISEEQIVYVNFEDERLIDMKGQELGKILEAYYSLFPESVSQTIYLFLDEIEWVDGWERFVRRLYDSGKYRIFLTGSSSRLLPSRVASSLRGRTWNITLYPFSFKEFLRGRGVAVKAHSLYTDEAYRIRHLFDEYLCWGGFPEIVSVEEWARCPILQNYYESVIFRDVVERHGVRQLEVVKELFRYLVNNFSRPFSVHKFYQLLKSRGVRAGKDFLYRLLGFIEESFYFFFVPIHSFSLKAQMVNPRKVYVVDNGLVHCLSESPTENRGWFLENLAAIEFKRRGYSLFYYRGKRECDFIAVRGLERLCVQVSEQSGLGREREGLKEAMSATDCEKGLLLTLDEEWQEGSVEAVPMWKWLLT